jgi:hypothetical protein
MKDRLEMLSEQRMPLSTLQDRFTRPSRVKKMR